MESIQSGNYDNRSILQEVLSTRSHLDLTGRVDQIDHSQSGHGGYSDIYTGYYRTKSDERVKVAVKKLQIFEDSEKQVMSMLIPVIQANPPCL